MQLDLTTFILEIINFLVLLWLLNRFLFKPVLNIIKKRQQDADAVQLAITQQRDDLDAEQAKLTAAQAELANAHNAAQQQLVEEINAERVKRLQALEQEIADERAKSQARLKASLAQQTREQQHVVAEQSLAFLRNYLQRLANAGLEHAIIELFLTDLAALKPDKFEKLFKVAPELPIKISTAYAVDTAERERIESVLTDIFKHRLTTKWMIDSRLFAGIAIALDGHILEASLAGGLDAFTATQSHTRAASL